MRKKIECEVDLNIHVIDEDDMAVNGAHLFFTVDPSTNNFNLTTPASGIVSTRLPPGPLQVQVQSPFWRRSSRQDWQRWKWVFLLASREDLEAPVESPSGVSPQDFHFAPAAPRLGVSSAW